MTTPKFPAHTPANNEDDDSDIPPTRPGSAFINALKDIGCGAAADGQPWPEPDLRIGRRIALADVDCARAGLTIALEMLLAGERIRQNGPDEDYPGDRVMEGLIMACMAINGQASARMRPQE
ncbi:hypothetical protein FJU31_13655 [Stenotrophomonas cyclobalanopsidis]|uniref:Uncharacterized protein n=1 Tax=Stenotrophomonas cyclobalanopsidis TaxID=2771362 RepID=A0ABQ6SYS3_9GAMM|nr:hypothetical protein [Stenotrophomonas cyclobalanopsidis]KAA8996002.1 hypothetical protein FJU31_13655 [Stenotrophomonas cyclobalanopsidis]